MPTPADNSLAHQVAELLREMAGDLPALSSDDSLVLFLPRSPTLDGQGRIVVSESDLRSVAGASVDFTNILGEGLPWVNVSFAGIHEGRALVTIDRPSTSEGRHAQTSVNFSGMTRRARAAGGSAAADFAIEPL